jgi:phospholipid N-methyltransferase
MLAGIELGPESFVVEYGPGTGVFTRAIQEGMAAAGGGRYLGIELDGDFCASLRRSFPEYEFVQGSVEQVQEVLTQRSLPPPTAIVSGLPLIFMDCMEKVIRDASRTLAPGGAFATFTYLQSCVMPAAFRVRATLRSAFAEVDRSPLVLRNLPPAFVLRGRTARFAAA